MLHTDVKEGATPEKSKEYELEPEKITAGTCLAAAQPEAENQTVSLATMEIAELSISC